MRQVVTLSEPYRKFEAGGLGLTAGDFSQLSKVDLIHPTRFADCNAQLR
jgi:hypothetical protein